MTAIPLKWKKIEGVGKVEINGPDGTEISSSYPALKVNGDIVSTSTATVPTINATTLNGSAIGSSPKFSDTTYTFASGTNGFSVTPLGGSAQTVDVTPSIINNITGTGASNYIAKFNGTNTITSGPLIGNDTTKYLRNDGSWVAPPDTKNTAGATDTSSKIFLIGATSQTDNLQTYSDDQVYATNGALSANSISTLSLTSNSIDVTDSSASTIQLDGTTGKVTCNKVSVQSGTGTFTKSSGGWTFSSCSWRRCGNIVTIHIQFKGSGSNVAVGNNSIAGTVSDLPLPPFTVRLEGYYSSTTLMGELTSTGGFNVRILSAALNLSTSNTATLSGTYIVDD